MNLKKRVKALESTLLQDPIVLYFADGSARELRGPRYFMLRLFLAAHGGEDVTPWEAEQLQLIRQCVSAREPGGGHMVELVAVALAAAETVRNDPELDRSEGEEVPER
jgi:hypothetical protein